MSVVVEHGRRGGDKRGNNEQRAARRRWLVATFRANVDVLPHPLSNEELARLGRASQCEWDVGSRLWRVPLGEGEPACRCYRCGKLLTEETVTADRIKPGCQGGTYRRENIRPACGGSEGCNQTAGGAHRGKRGHINGRAK